MGSKQASSAKRSNSTTKSQGQADAAPLMGGRRMRFAKVQEDAVAYSPIPNIEGLNRDIVAMLQEDGRAAFSSIAQRLGVSEATVRTRVARMRESNLIHFITVVNPLALGYTSWAMLGIKVAQGVSADEVARYFRDCPEVVYAMRVAARFDLLAEVVCEAPDELRDFLDTHCYGSETVASVEPMVGLGLYKSLFKWDQPLVAGNGNNHGQKARRNGPKQ
ncbi:MAG: Lrp/AsnC family transcriptional regulator [Gammaproteobacteria bacterium]